MVWKLLKISHLSGNTVWTQASGIQSLVNFFGIFNELLSTQNAYLARFARNIEWDFSVIFKTMIEEPFFLEKRGLVKAVLASNQKSKRPRDSSE